jgi:nucleoside 2-deoxyribosyltransferase
MKFYLSHPIRGEAGDKATVEDIRKNNEAAIAIANYIRNEITASVDIHIPAEMENFVDVAYQMNILSVEQILAVDCKIIENCDAVLIYAPFGNIVSGCKVELDHALQCHKPVFIFEDAHSAVEMIAQFVLRS